jgi:hypothetical protein
MNISTLTRIRRTIVATLAVAAVAAPSALADPWARDAYQRQANAPDLVDRYMRAHDERFVPDLVDRYLARSQATQATHDERFLPPDFVDRFMARSQAQTPAHDERFAPVRGGVSQLASAHDGSEIGWGSVATGVGIGIGTMLLLGVAALGVRGRRLAHS